MKMNKFLGVLATIVLGLTFSQAQQQPRDANGASGASASGPAPVSQTQDTRNDHDYGWIGLLGLVGLAGLLGRKRDVTRHDTGRSEHTSNMRRVA